MSAPSAANSLSFRVGRLLMHVRPAPLAVALKRLLFVRRRTVRTAAGTFWLDPASDSGQRVATGGAYDAHFSALLPRLVGPGDTYVDVGANEGFFCVEAARLVGDTGRVVAIEPQARLQEVLRRNFMLNACRVETHALAISDRAGTAELRLAPDTNNSSSGFAAATRYPLGRQPVETLTLAALVARLGLTTPFVLKMDIEGWEHEAVLGSPEIFQRQCVRAFILELHTPVLAQRGLDPEAIPRFLRACGYAHLPGSAGWAWGPTARPS